MCRAIFSLYHGVRAVAHSPHSGLWIVLCITHTLVSPPYAMKDGAANLVDEWYCSQYVACRVFHPELWPGSESWFQKVCCANCILAHMLAGLVGLLYVSLTQHDWSNSICILSLCTCMHFFFTGLQFFGALYPSPPYFNRTPVMWSIASKSTLNSISRLKPCASIPASARFRFLQRLLHFLRTFCAVNM